MPLSKPYPRLRPVEVFPGEHEGQKVLIVHDPAGLAVSPITVSPAGLFIFSLLDGKNGPDEIQAAFRQQFGATLPFNQLENLVAQLDQARYLDSVSFLNHVQKLHAEYHAAPARRSAESQTEPGEEHQPTADMLERLFRVNEPAPPHQASGRIAGLVAPHLDYPRGQRCYADAYSLLRQGCPARRFVILGTNHFGQATSVVATGKDFVTSLGTTSTDRAFIHRLSERCHTDLCEYEFDHQREHSVELQLMLLQYVLGAGHFQIVPVLCHDPCGPSGTGPYDGNGVDLRVFAEALRDLVQEDPDQTIIVAGADLSHVGTRFGDQRDLDDEFRKEVELKDRAALEAFVSGDAGQFLEVIRSHDNSTRICSSGCLFALMTALPRARAEVLRYDQASDRPSGTCVTCASIVLREHR
ncbi:MAG TPA: AmmeMemoRadiSam system protein B [Phycisphaerae bacterium]|nr:AmmeMemoRadiSam system protein B [Phycisphaerae bacterium]HRY69168.1 AmmeMemoRadiSam system protein B [Phycisphaerae bacterium]HSA26129.1 AmmeMemoRadiSam system protein B [Phycisphaerae bacterium]